MNGRLGSAAQADGYSASVGDDAVSDTGIKIGFNVSHEGRWVLLGVVEEEASGMRERAASGGEGGDVEIEVGVDVMVPPSDPADLKEALIPQVSGRQHAFPLLYGFEQKLADA